jgi:hypothetical protein
MLVFESGHLRELKEALGAGFPALLVTVGLSLVLLVLALIPRSGSAVPLVGDLIVTRRRQVAIAAGSVCLSAAIGFVVAFWAL